MNQTFRKLGHTDFRARIKRVDPRFYHMGHAAYARDKTVRRPFGAIVAGFMWFYVVASVATNRANIEASLNQGALPEHYHGWIFAGLAVLLASSGVLLALHIFRYVFHRGNRRKNSGSILAGALAALMLFYTPTSVWQQGFGMLDGHSQQALLTASNTLDISLSNIRSVSSYGR